LEHHSLTRRSGAFGFDILDIDGLLGRVLGELRSRFVRGDRVGRSQGFGWSSRRVNKIIVLGGVFANNGTVHVQFVLVVCQMFSLGTDAVQIVLAMFGVVASMGSMPLGVGAVGELAEAGAFRGAREGLGLGIRFRG
jgi:hypothetical protein